MKNGSSFLFHEICNNFYKSLYGQNVQKGAMFRMFTIQMIGLVYLIIGLVWTAYTAYSIGDFFEVEDLANKLGRISAFMISIAAWPVVLLIPYTKGFIESRNERKQS